jgi:hypothetical protein
VPKCPKAENHISGVMVVLALSVVDCGFELRSGKTNDYKIGICYFSIKHAALRKSAMTGWLGIRIMCQSGATCLAADCCFSDHVISLRLGFQRNVLAVSSS